MTPATLSPNWQRGQARRRMGWWQRRHTWRQAVEACAGGTQPREACFRLRAVPLAAWRWRGIVCSPHPPRRQRGRSIHGPQLRLSHLAVVRVGPASARAHHCLGEVQHVHPQTSSLWMDISPTRQVCSNPTQPGGGMMYSILPLTSQKGPINCRVTTTRRRTAGHPEHTPTPVALASSVSSPLFPASPTVRDTHSLS
jgi:hypothetical protein